jgi:hypothetical protein
MSSLTLHPAMTVHDIAAWCREHRMYVIIDWQMNADGTLVPLLMARPDVDSGATPALLRIQA